MSKTIKDKDQTMDATLEALKAVFAQVETNRQNDAEETSHMRLGEMIDALDRIDPAKKIELDGPGNLAPQDAHSYRGYYSDLAFEFTRDDVTVGQFLEELREADGNTYTGWKGGEYTMSSDTLIWFSWEGQCDGNFPVAVEDRESLATIRTAREAW